MSEPNIYYIYNEYVVVMLTTDEDLEDNPVEDIIEYDDSEEWYNA